MPLVGRLWPSDVDVDVDADDGVDDDVDDDVDNDVDEVEKDEDDDNDGDFDDDVIRMMGKALCALVTQHSAEKVSQMEMVTS